MSLVESLTRDDEPQFARWKHQQQALDRMRSRRGFALFMDMRTGKTKVILDEWAEMVASREVSQLLVIAPAGVYRTWSQAARDHLPLGLLRRSALITWSASGSQKETGRVKVLLGRPGPKILLVNVEALSAVKRAQDLCLNFCLDAPTTVVIDESTTIKERKAKRTKFCLKLSQTARARRILTGTPSPQGPLDLFSQFAFLDYKILGWNFTAFRNHYAKIVRKPFGPGGRMIDVVDGYKNLEQLKNRIAPHSYRVKLSDCYDLPEKMYLRRDVEMSDEQRKVYAQIKEYATAVLERAEKEGEIHRVTATIVLTQVLRLHQVLAGHVTSDDHCTVDLAENKTSEMLEILANHQGKAIIWVAYDRSVAKVVHALTEAYGKGSAARFWGGNVDTREDEAKRFLIDPSCRFMVATAASGGRGRTWAVADLVIYYSSTHSLEHRLQSEERPQAVGKTQSVAYFDLVCPGTVEEKILHALRNKMSLSDAVTGDDWREWVV